MLASEKLVEAFNRQIGHEMAASMQYIAVACFFESETLPQLARFFYKQSDEERQHALRFVKFLNDADGKVAIPSLPAPKSDFGTAEEAVQLSLDWEEEVTRQIYDLVETARADKNYIAMRFLDWFVTEQMEEVTSMRSLLHVIRRAGPQGLLYVEEYLARQGGKPGPEASPETGE
jgi:bacterioferritin B